MSMYWQNKNIATSAPREQRSFMHTVRNLVQVMALIVFIGACSEDRDKTAASVAAMSVLNETKLEDVKTDVKVQENIVTPAAKRQEKYQKSLKDVFDCEGSSLTMEQTREQLRNTWNAVLKADGNRMLVRVGDAIYIQDPSQGDQIVSEYVYWLRIAADIHNTGVSTVEARNVAKGILKGLDKMTELSKGKIFPAWVVRVQDSQIKLDNRKDNPGDSASDADHDYVMALLVIRNNLKTGNWLSDKELNLSTIDARLNKLIIGLETQYKFEGGRYIMRPSADWDRLYEYHPDYFSPETCFAIADYLSAFDAERAGQWRQRGNDSFDFLLTVLATFKDSSGNSYIPEKAYITATNGRFMITANPKFNKQNWEVRGAKRLASALNYIKPNENQIKLLINFLNNWRYHSVDGLDAAVALPLAIQLGEHGTLETAKIIKDAMQTAMGKTVYVDMTKYYEVSLIAEALVGTLYPYHLSAIPQLSLSNTDQGDEIVSSIPMVSAEVVHNTLTAVAADNKREFQKWFKTARALSEWNYKTTDSSKLMPLIANKITWANGEIKYTIDAVGIASDSRTDLQILAAGILAEQKGWLDYDDKWFLALYLEAFLNNAYEYPFQKNEKGEFNLFPTPVIGLGHLRPSFNDDTQVYEIALAEEDLFYLKVIRKYVEKPSFLRQLWTHLNPFNNSDDRGYLLGHSGYYDQADNLLRTTVAMYEKIGQDGRAYFRLTPDRKLSLITNKRWSKYEKDEIISKYGIRNLEDDTTLTANSLDKIQNIKIKPSFSINNLRPGQSGFWATVWDNFTKSFRVTHKLSSQYDRDAYPQIHAVNGDYVVDNTNYPSEFVNFYRAPQPQLFADPWNKFVNGMNSAMGMKGFTYGHMGQSILEQVLMDAAHSPEITSITYNFIPPKTDVQILRDRKTNAVEEYVWAMLSTIHGRSGQELVTHIDGMLARIGSDGTVSPDHIVVQNLYWQKLLLWNYISPNSKEVMKAAVEYYADQPGEKSFPWKEMLEFLKKPAQDWDIYQHFNGKIDGHQINTADESFTIEKLFAMQIVYSRAEGLIADILFRRDIRTILEKGKNIESELERNKYLKSELDKYLDRLPNREYRDKYGNTILAMILFSRDKYDEAGKNIIVPAVNVELKKQYILDALQKIDIRDEKFNKGQYRSTYLLLNGALRLIYADEVYAILKTFTDDIGDIQYKEITPENLRKLDRALYQLINFTEQTSPLAEGVKPNIKLNALRDSFSDKGESVDKDGLLNLFKDKYFRENTDLYERLWKGFHRSYESQGVIAGILDDLFWPGEILKGLKDESARLKDNPVKAKLLEEYYQKIGRQLYDQNNLGMALSVKNRYQSFSNMALQVVFERIKIQKIVLPGNVGQSLKDLDKLKMLTERWDQPLERAKVILAEATILAKFNVPNGAGRYREIQNDPVLKIAPDYVKDNFNKLKATIIRNYNMDSGARQRISKEKEKMLRDMGVIR